jgi:hypothetical protein
MTTQEGQGLAGALRFAAMDGGAEAEEHQELVVGRWLDRASWALERLESEALGTRLAAELLVAWQALGRMAQDAPHREEREALHSVLSEAVVARRDVLPAMAQQDFTPHAWAEALREHAAEVGSPSVWDAPTAERAMMLVEGLDDALLCEDALEALDAPLTAAFASGLEAANEALDEGADSLVPAYRFIQANTAVLNMLLGEPPASYMLWSELAQACKAWAAFEGLRRMARLAADEVLSYPPRPAISPTPRDPRAPRRAQDSTWRVPKPAQFTKASASTQAEDGEQYRWRGDSGWEVLTRWPSTDEADDEDVAFIVSGLPCAGELLVFGVRLKVSAGDNDLVMTAGVLRRVDDEQEAVKFVGEDGRVEVGRLLDEE